MVLDEKRLVLKGIPVGSRVWVKCRIPMGLPMPFATVGAHRERQASITSNSSPLSASILGTIEENSQDVGPNSLESLETPPCTPSPPNTLYNGATAGPMGHGLTPVHKGPCEEVCAEEGLNNIKSQLQVRR